MAGIYSPNRQDKQGQALGLASMVPGPVGVAASAASLLRQKPSQPQMLQESENAMQRRMMAKSGDSFQQLREAVSAVPQLPDELRREYARPLLQAYSSEAQKRGIDPFAR